MNPYKKAVIVIFVILGLGLFKSPVFIFAQQANQKPTSTSTPATSELNSKKEAISDAFRASYDELEELKKALNSITVDSESWQNIKDILLQQTEEIKKYYDNAASGLKDENTTQESIRSLAKELKSFREDIFSEYLKKSINFILIFEEANLLKIADSRLDKVSSDLNRLKKQSDSKFKLLNPLFEKAQAQLKLSHDLNSAAKDLLYNYFESADKKGEDKKTDQEENKSKAELLQISATGPGEQPSDQQEVIRDLSQKSLNALKTTYEIFVKMSKAL